MHQAFPRTVLCLLAALLILPAVVFGLDLRSPTTIGPQDLPRIEVITSSDQGVTLEFELPTLAVESIAIGSRQFQSIEIPGGGLIGAAGSPALPTFTRLVAIPRDTGVVVTTHAEEVQNLDGILLAPMQPDDGAVPVIDDAAYARDEFLEITAGGAGGPAVMRNFRVVPVTFQPVTYNPASQTLRVTPRMRVEVRFEGRNVENNPVVTHRSVPPSFDRMYQDLVVNYEEETAANGGQSVAPGTWLLIMQNDNAVISRLQPLVDWRKRQGFPVVTATTAQTGTSNSSIKNWIQNAYDTWEAPPEYIVLAGDVGGTYSIATFYETLSGYGGEGDHPYTQLDGTDPISDAHIGRLSFSSTTELEAIVNKIVGYESTPYMSDPGWYKRACLVGDPYDSGYSTVMVQQWIKVRLREMGWTDIDSIFSSPFVSRMSTALNRGDAIFSYRGYYGMSGWANSNTYALSNGWKMPFVISITCDTGSFATGTSRSEGFLRANAGANSPRGGIGAIGTATIGTHTRFNNCVHLGTCYGLLYAGMTHLGEALTRGKMELYLNYQAIEPNRVVIWSHWNNLMGDPAVDCWLDTPTPLTVQAPASVPVGANAVTIQVQDEGGAASEGAQVCLLKGTETQAVGITDAQGRVELPVDLPTAGTMLLTITKHDRQPHLANVPVTGATRYVGFLASGIDDDGVGESTGNGDGIVNPSETIELDVQVKNFGTQTANGVQATLTTTDPYVTIVDGQETFGDLAVNATAWSADDFGFTVAPTCPHGRVLRFGLDVTSGGDEWHSLIDVPVVSADLVTDGSYTMTGVGGSLDPGETGQLSVKLVNQGGATAVAPIASMLSLSEFIDIPDAAAVYPTIPAAGGAENTTDTFTVHAAPETPQGYEARLRIILSFSGGVRDTTDFLIPIGARSSDDPVGPDHYGYYAFDDTDVTYPDHPTYQWVEIDPNYGGQGGIEVVLGDFDNYQDKSRVVDLPFPFQYYGETFTNATICSNGWLAMGSTYLAVYRNWTIPGAGGPENLIAPFWDDLYQSGNAKVYQWHDAANHRWIVEWSRLRNDAGAATEVFQAILYDPAFHTTETGDGIILFQYDTVSDVDSQDHYSTIGIENGDHTDGLLYRFYNQNQPGAATPQSGRAIRFVPTREVLVGLIHGAVSNASNNGTPLSGATVTVLETGADVQTAPDGSYQTSVSPGTYSVSASFAGFEADTVGGVAVAAGGSIQIDFSLRDIVAPAIETTLIPTTNDSGGPYTLNVRITDPSPLAEAKAYYRTNGGAFQALTLQAIGGNRYRTSIPGQPWSTKVEYYVLARDVGNNSATDPAAAPSDLYVFYVAPTVQAYHDEFEVEGGWTVGAPGDGATSGTWVRENPNAIFHDAEMVQPEDDHTADPGANCWVTGNAPPGSQEGVGDVDGGSTTLTSGPIVLSLEGEVFLRYYRWFSNDTGPGGSEDFWVAQISDNNGASWVDLERTNVSDRSWHFLEFDLSNYISFTDQVRLRFIAEDVGTASIVEAAVDDVEIIFTGVFTVGVEDVVPARFELAQNQPNPFNPRTTVRFSLEKGGPVRLAVYDVAGRLVRRLAEGTRPAGPQAIVWDGRDDEGRAVPSGVYLYRLDTGGRTATRKMLLLQ